MTSILPQCPIEHLHYSNPSLSINSYEKIIHVCQKNCIGAIKDKVYSAEDVVKVLILDIMFKVMMILYASGFFSVVLIVIIIIERFLKLSKSVAQMFM